MRGEYRFLRSRGGTRFARVTIESSPADDWTVTFAHESELDRDHRVALGRGIALAIRAESLRSRGCHSVVVERLVHTVVDTTDDAVECAAAIATWRSFGHEEAEATLTFEDDRWHVSFDAAAG